MGVAKRWGRWLSLLCAGALALPAWAQTGAAQPPTAETREVIDWIVASQDHQQLPFAVVDKKEARLFVYDAQGRLRGTTPALLGLAPGDGGLASMQQRDVSRLAAAERTTPAGRFASEPGHNLKGEDIVWIDYDAALAIHRLRPAPAHERRAERLASATPKDNRISLGCVVVPVAFYEQVVAPVLGKRRGVVYVLPEARPARELFGWQATGL